jgi:WhiB family transcriptional regulator, redox-sensing transcriptional regulator
MSRAAPPEKWADRALCAEIDPDLFFPEGQGNHSLSNARRVCAACEVRAECLAYALEHDELEGVWGGLSEKERREPRKQLRLAT